MRPLRCTGRGGFSFLRARTIGGKGSGRKPGGPGGPGRPKGSRGILDLGETEAVEAVRDALATRGENDPVVLFAMDRLLQIASGQRRHRWVGDEYRALTQILDRREGRPTEKVQHSGEIRHRVEIVDDADGEG